MTRNYLFDLLKVNQSLSPCKVFQWFLNVEIQPKETSAYTVYFNLHKESMF